MANTDKQFYFDLVSKEGVHPCKIVDENFDDLVRVFLDEAPIEALQERGYSLMQWLENRLAEEMK